MKVHIVVSEIREMPYGAQEWRDSYISGWHIVDVFTDSKKANKCAAGHYSRRVITKTIKTTED